MKDYYDILGIQKNASEDDVKKAFRKLAQKFHPDKKGGDEARFKEVSEAYSVLSDKKKRSEYDRFGAYQAGGASQSQGGFGGGFDFSQFAQNFGGFQQGQFQDFDIGDIFSEFFSGGNANRARRGRDISIDIEISFKDAVFGTDRRVLISKIGTCDTCGGSGAEKGTKTVTCTTCNGRGEIHENRNTFFGSFTSTRACPTCHGKGVVPEKPCHTCHGEGVTKKEEEIAISIPAGVEDGEMIRMPGRGEAAFGGVSGDLYVKLHVKADSSFIREGNNLLTTSRIKISDALLGTTLEIRSLDGVERVRVEPGISHGDVLKIRGKGVPYGRGSRGDLHVRVEIDFPKNINSVAKTLVEKLREQGL